MRTLSVTVAASFVPAELGGVSFGVVTVFQLSVVADPVITCCVHPAGRLGAVTPSNRSLRPQGPGGGAHTSFVVQALPSLHALVLFACTHNPFAGLQESSVHTLPSSQLTAVPTQVPFEHVSLLVQAFPSVQGAEFGVCRQPRPGSQLSFVHG